MRTLDGYGEDSYRGRGLTHVKRGPRIGEKEKLAILREGEKNGINAVCSNICLQMIA
jgi:hypothetical protein